MSPDGLCTVQCSWSELCTRRAEVLDALAHAYHLRGSVDIAPSVLAGWLFGAVEVLVELLPSPSRLEACARAIGATWPVPGTHPTFAREGRAWLDAAAACTTGWTEVTDRAWRQAWLLLSDVLAAETLSPFADDCR
jgi:hypothetical protein